MVLAADGYGRVTVKAGRITIVAGTDNYRVISIAVPGPCEVSLGGDTNATLESVIGRA